MKEECIIFGASSSGVAAYRILKNSFEVLGFADNNKKKWGTYLENKLIYSPEQLIEYKNIKIIIASVYYSAICQQLNTMGIMNVEVFYLLGSANENISNEYKLFKIDSKILFDKFFYVKEMVDKILSDFSYNYSNEPYVQMEYSIKHQDKDTKKRVLFVAYIFPPLSGGGVQRSLYFVKYLRKFGYEPIVLTVGENDRKILTDDTMINIIDEDIEIIRIDNKKFVPEFLSESEQEEIFNLYCGVLQSKEWISKYKEYIKNTGTKMIPDNKIIWVNECLKQIESKINLQEIDIIFTTGNPFSTYVLGYYIKKKYGIYWIQDYRDPWGVNNYYWSTFYKNDIDTKNMQKEMEKVLISFSDAVVVDDESEIYKYEREYSVPHSKLFPITNGYDEEDFNEINIQSKINKKFTLCFNGMLYGERNPLVILDAINALIKKGDIKEEDICWEFNGIVEQKWNIKLQENDTYGIIKYNGYLAHCDSIASMMEADLLLLLGIEGIDAEGGYTGKFFEYLRTGKTILALSSVGSSCEKILDRTGSGKNFSYNDFIGIKEYIVRLYNNWKNGINNIKPDFNVIEKFSRENLTRELSNVFNKILE